MVIKTWISKSTFQRSQVPDGREVEQDHSGTRKFNKKGTKTKLLAPLSVIAQIAV